MGEVDGGLATLEDAFALIEEIRRMLTVTPLVLENSGATVTRPDAAPRKRDLYYRPVLRRGLPDVREVNGFFIFELGQCVMLSLLPTNVDLTPSLGTIASEHNNLRTFAETKENQEDLPNSVDDARALIKLLEEIIARKPYPSISDAERLNIIYRLTTFRDRLGAELARVYSYVLEEKGGRSVRTLWKNAALVLIDATALTHLSDFVIENVDEAGRAWVVERLTAVGFHMMRAVECVLREYKSLVTGQGFSFVDKRGTTQYQGFGTLVGDLEKRLEGLKLNKQNFGRLELVIGILRPLSKLYRDPLSHPELNKLYENDAKLAFEQGIAAINTMVQDAVDGGAHFTKAFVAGGKF
jgi:hypothetical protein